MKSHPLLESLSQFNKLIVWENRLPLNMGRAGLVIERNSAVGDDGGMTPILFQVQANGELKIMAMSAEASGWRVKAGRFYLYLGLYDPNQDFDEWREHCAKTLRAISGAAICDLDEGRTDFESFFNFVSKKTIWESDYKFDLNPEIQKVIDKLPDDHYLHLAVQSDGSVKQIVLRKDPGGWRVRVGSTYLYLTHTEPDPQNPEFLKHIFAIHQHLMTYGFYYPREKDLLQYWRHPDDQFNKAENYISNKPRSNYLADIIQEHCDPIGSVLELGCNVGRNLNHLRETFNVVVSGIEISAYARSLMRKTFPELKKSKVYLGDMTQVIETLEDNQFDLVFSMAALMHLHPTTPDDFFYHMARVAGRYIITIENESGGSNRNWPRDYRLFLESYGAKEIYSECLINHELAYYTTRVFTAPDKPTA